MSEPLPPEPVNGARATEADEEEVLRSLYGEPDADGVHRGDGPPDPDGAR
ncbi:MULTISPECIES: hypothetical protein [unclassified Spirillospora]